MDKKDPRSYNRQRPVEEMNDLELIMWTLHYILQEHCNNGRYLVDELAQRVGREPHGEDS